MRALAAIFAILILALQYPIWLGKGGWLRVRDEYKQAKGAAYSLAEFNDRALKEGAVPLPVLSRLLQ